MLNRDLELKADEYDKVARAIDTLCRRKYAAEFLAPVDYIGLGLRDYTDVIKRPMDLSTLRKNLLAGRYKTLRSFLADGVLIFSNCRQYNASDPYYMKLTQECEQGFVQTIGKTLNLSTDDIFRLLKPAGEENGENPHSGFEIGRLQKLIIAIGRLSPQDQTYAVQWYAKQANVPFHYDALRIRFSTQDAPLLTQLEDLVNRLLSAHKAARQ